MDPSRISIRARLRTPWEAVDLGFVMARAWWRPLFLSWAIPSAIVYLVLALCFYRSPEFALFGVWWLKPLWDRYPLYIASRAMFGERVTVGQALRHSYTLLKTDILPWLLWRRFSLSRAFDMPVTVLEGNKGTQRRHRLTLLHQAGGSAAAWLTLVCVHVEMIITMGVAGLMILLIPEGTDFDLGQTLLEPSLTMEWLYYLLTYGAMILVAPFYTMAGFALYISRRIDLEGWDIEVRFRHIARHNARTGGALAPLLAAALIVLGSWLPLAPAPAQAAEPDYYFADSHFTDTHGQPPTNSDTHSADPASPRLSDDAGTDPQAPLTAEESQRLIDGVLQGEDFVREKVISNWRFKEPDPENEEAEEVPEWFIRLVEFLEGWYGEPEGNEGPPDAQRLLALSVEFLLWVVAVSLAIYLIYRYRDILRSLVREVSPQKAADPTAPEVLFGLDVRREAIPRDTTEQVLALWRQGESRQALGLLYRATLSGLMHEYHYRFREGDTEQECAAAVAAGSPQPLSAFVTELTLVWQRLAYGHRPPAESEVQRLCERWPTLFSGKSDYREVPR